MNNFGALLRSWQLKPSDIGRLRSGYGRLGLTEDRIQLRVVCTQCLIRFFLGDIAATHQSLCIFGAGRRHIINHLVHLRLSHRRVISLVVTTATVAEQINYGIAAKALAILECETTCPNYGLGVVGVYVEDRRLGHPSNIGCVGGGTSILRRCREADLVIHHDVYGTAGSVATQISHLQGFHDDTLCGKRGVTMNQDGQNGMTFDTLVVKNILLGAHDAFQNGVNSLQM